MGYNRSSGLNSLKKRLSDIDKKFKIIANIGVILLTVLMITILFKNYAEIDISSKLDYDLYNEKMTSYKENYMYDEFVDYNTWLNNPNKYDGELVYVEGIVPLRKISDDQFQTDISQTFKVYSLEKSNTYLVLIVSQTDPWIDIDDYMHQSIDMVCFSQHTTIKSKDANMLVGVSTYDDYAPKDETTTQNKYNDDRTYSQYQSTVYGAVLDDYFENSYDVYDFLNVESYVDGEMYMSDCTHPAYDEFMLSPVLYDGKKVAIDPLLKDVHTVYSSDSDNIIMLEGYFFEDQSPYMYVILHSFDLEEDDFVKGARYMVAGVSHFTYYEDVAIPYIDCYYIASYQ